MQQDFFHGLCLIKKTAGLFPNLHRVFFVVFFWEKGWVDDGAICNVPNEVVSPKKDFPDLVQRCAFSKRSDKKYKKGRNLICHSTKLRRG